MSASSRDLITEANRYLSIRSKWMVFRLRSTGQVVGAGLPSRSEPGKYNLVDIRDRQAITCSCADYRFRHAGRGTHCAHAHAVYLAMAAKRDREVAS